MAQRDLIKIEGLKECDAALQELPKSTSRGVLTRVLKKEGQPIANDASRFAPDDPSTHGEANLKTNILVQTVPARERESHVEVAIGPSRKAFHGQFQEFGAAQHGPHPFMRPAWDKNVMGVIAGIRDRLADEIEKTRKRIARKAELLAAKMKR